MTEVVEEFKCMVKTCQNRTGEGKFTGPLCAPCANALANGQTGTNQAAVNRIMESVGYTE